MKKSKKHIYRDGGTVKPTILANAFDSKGEEVFYKKPMPIAGSIDAMKQQMGFINEDITNPLNYYDVEYERKNTTLKNKLEANDKTVINPNNTIKLKSGRFRGAAVPKAILDRAIDSAEKNKIPAGKLISLIGRESTFGEDPSVKGTGSGLKELVSGWNVAEPYKPKQSFKFLEENNVPGVVGVPSTHGYNYSSNDIEGTKQYLRKHPELLKKYKQQLATTPDIGDQNSFDLAAVKLRDKGVESYNPGDPNYTAMYNKDYDTLTKEQELQNYLKQKGVKYKNGGIVKKRNKYANGGVAGGKGFDVSGLANNAKPILDGILSLIEGTPDYSDQPIINASTMRNMATPYSFAMGGSIEDYDEEELFELQQQADELGITVEELLEQQNIEQEENFLEEEPIEEDEEEPIEEESNYDYYALGGKVPIEVEGGEVMESPNGNLKKVVGPSHENGGVDVKAHKGERIYSDRLSIDGKSMADRKVNREKNLAKLNKLGETGSGTPLKNTIERTSQIIEMEEQKDMALQQIAGKLYGQPGEAAWGDDGVDWNQYLPETPYYPNMPVPRLEVNSVIQDTPITTPITAPASLGNLTPTSFNVNNAVVNNDNTDDETNDAGLGLGDYVGMAGNLFNAIAPIVNTRNAARNSKPNINRYKGFGHNALETNQSAQDYSAANRANTRINLNSSNNAAFARNRNGARSVNTMRALDIATNVGANKASNDIDSSFSNQMIGLLGQEGQLENIQDQMEMKGQTDVDIRDQMDLDNYYSNMAANLTNFGTNVQGLGKSINRAKSNRTDIKHLNQMSVNGIGFDEDEDIITVGKKKYKAI